MGHGSTIRILNAQADPRGGCEWVKKATEKNGRGILYIYKIEGYLLKGKLEKVSTAFRGTTRIIKKKKDISKTRMDNKHARTL